MYPYVIRTKISFAHTITHMKTYNMNRQNVQGKYFKGGKTVEFGEARKNYGKLTFYIFNVLKIFFSLLLYVLQLCFWSIFIWREKFKFFLVNFIEFVFPVSAKLIFLYVRLSITLLEILTVKNIGGVLFTV